MAGDTAGATGQMPVPTVAKKRDQQASARRRADRRQPTGNRASDQSGEAAPIREEGQSPKSEDGQFAAVQRLLRELGEEIKNCGERNRCQPKAREISGKPGIDEALHGAAEPGPE